MATSDKSIQFIVKPTLEELKKRHERRLKGLQDTKPTFKKIATFLDRWVQQNFKTEGGNVGGWAPFKLGGRYVKGKGIDTTAKLLQDTGRLRASFLPFAFNNNAGIGSDLPYSKKQQETRHMLPEGDKEQAAVRDEARRLLEQDIGEKLK